MDIKSNTSQVPELSEPRQQPRVQNWIQVDPDTAAQILDQDSQTAIGGHDDSSAGQGRSEISRMPSRPTATDSTLLRPDHPAPPDPDLSRVEADGRRRLYMSRYDMQKDL